MTEEFDANRGSIAVCTIIALNYLPVARVMLKSLKAMHPEVAAYVVIVDRPDEARRIEADGATVLTIEDVDFSGDDYRRSAAIYDVTEFCTSIKPLVLAQLVARHDVVFYLDPDIRLYGRLDDLVSATLQSGWSLTPHCLAPIPRTGAGPTEFEIMGAGAFNLGFVGVTKGVLHVLDWWWERLRRHALVAQADQLFTDQRWIDLAAPMFKPHVEHSTAYNVAYWNLDQRRLWFEGDVPMVDDNPLVFFHFSGYDPGEPWWLSKYQRGNARVLMSDSPVYARLYEEYRRELEEERRVVGPVPSYGWRDMMPGLEMHKGIRRLYRRELIDAESAGRTPPPCPFIPDEFEGFRKWLVGRDSRVHRDIPRHVSAIIDIEPELSGRFDTVDDRNRADLAGWIRHAGAARYPSLTLFPTTLESVAPASPAIRDTGERRPGVDVVGYLTADLGVGEAARLVARSLRAAGVDVSLSAWARTESRLGDTSLDIDDSPCHRTAVLAVNADQLPALGEELGGSFLRGRYVIGQWFWELEEAPSWFAPAFRYVDEIWAPTTFIARTIQSVAPRRIEVVHMPPAIVAPTPSESPSCIGTGPYTFLFVFDYLSVLRRKNPVGLIDAYTAAFPEPGIARLVLKTINSEFRIEEAEQVRWLVRNRPDIQVVDAYKSRSEVARMMTDADCYVSLHRSEGLGLTIAEAMALGKPVIATNYSGNTDFMTDQTSVAIPWSRVPVGEAGEGYPPTSTWAEPDLEAAARAMRHLALHPEEGRILGDRARSHVLTHFDPAIVGERMAERIRNGKRRWRGR